MILILQPRTSDLLVWAEACAWGLVRGLCHGQPGCGLVLLWVPLPQGCVKLVWFSLLSPRGLHCWRGERTVSVLLHGPAMGTSQATLRENEHLTHEDKHSEFRMINHPLSRSGEPKGNHGQPWTRAGRALQFIETLLSISWMRKTKAQTVFTSRSHSEAGAGLEPKLFLSFL